MKSVQPMSLSMTPMKRYDNPESRCESYMPAAHGELPNSIPLTVPKPLEKLKPHAPSTTYLYWVYPDIPNAIADLLDSLTSDLGIQSADKPIVCSMTSRMSSLLSTGGGMNINAGSSGSGGDGNGNDVGTCGGKYSNDGRGGSGGEGCSG
nr:hypothetical protein [Tanacetum cinerariifolium]